MSAGFDVCAQELFNGGKVILSTKHFSHNVYAMADTVCVFAKPPGDSRRPHLFQLRNGTDTWDSIEVYGYEKWGGAPGSSSMVGFENRFDTTLKQTVGKIWIARSVDDIRFINVGRPGDPIPREFIHKVTPHHYNPSVVLVQTYTQSWHYQHAYITTDGGESWQKFMPAYLPQDYYREYYYGFDARHPQRIHIGINGENPNNMFNLGYRSVYTDDWGKTFIDTVINIDGGPQDYRVPNTEYGLGIWSGIGGLSYYDPTNTPGAPKYWYLTSDSLFLQPGQAPGRVRLSWLENARKSLLPNFDSTKENLRFLVASAGPITIGYHSKTPNLLVLTLFHSFPADTNNSNESMLAMSQDFGKTWTLLARLPNGNSSPDKPTDFKVFDRISIDPTGPHIYVTYRHTKYAPSSIFIGSAHTACWRNVLTSVSSEEPSQKDDSDLVVFPNPASGSATILIRNRQSLAGHGSETLRIYRANGEHVSTRVVNHTPETDWEMKLPGLSPGVYFIVLTKSSETHTAKFIVVD